MKLIARKPCSFGGKDFFIGEEVPEELVLNPGFMVQAGVLAKAGDTWTTGADEKEPEQDITLCINTGKGTVYVSVTREELQSVFLVLTGAASDAEEVISAMESNDALILLHASDNRKSVKALVESRAKELESAGDT